MGDPLPPRRQEAAIFLLATMVLSIIVGRSYFEARNGPDVPLNPQMIAVAGEIKRPGYFLLAGPEVTVGQVIEAAGGLRHRAAGELPAEMAAGPVRGGQAVHLKVTPQGPVVVDVRPMPAAARLTWGEKLDVNSSSEEELMLVPQMKAAFAAVIVKQRRQACWRNLMALETIPGVGPKTVEKWQPYLEAADCGMGGINEKKQ